MNWTESKLQVLQQLKPFRDHKLQPLLVALASHLSPLQLPDEEAQLQLILPSALLGGFNSTTRQLTIFPCLLPGFLVTGPWALGSPPLFPRA